MALWLQCQDAVFLCSSYLDWLSERSQSATVSSHTDPNHRDDLDSDSDAEIEELQSESCNAAPTNISPTLPIVHVLAKTPAHPQQSVQHLITAHGVTMFLPALKSFLHKHMPRNNIVPSLHNHFDVY
jgi:hypothetical protein